MKMKLGVVIASVAAACVVNAAQVDIVTSGDDGLLFDGAGSQLSLSQLWIELVIDGNGDTDFSAMIAGNLGGIGSETEFGGAHASTSDDSTQAGWNTFWELDPLVAFGGDYTIYDGDGNPTTITFGAPNGESFYFRWFNSSDKATATEAGIIYNSAWVTDLNGSVAVEGEVTFGGDASGSNNGTGWQTMPVPEPGTIAMLGLGIAGLAARRKMRKA